MLLTNRPTFKLCRLKCMTSAKFRRLLNKDVDCRGIRRNFRFRSKSSSSFRNFSFWKFRNFGGAKSFLETLRPRLRAEGQPFFIQSEGRHWQASSKISPLLHDWEIANATWAEERANKNAVSGKPEKFEKSKFYPLIKIRIIKMKILYNTLVRIKNHPEYIPLWVIFGSWSTV